MKKTAVQEVFSELENLHPHLFNIYSSEGKQFVNHFHKYLEIEREQIVKAYEKGAFNIGCINQTSEQYYVKTYKKN
jgi:hypothetical protein